VEAPNGIEPLIAVLQTAPLATWVRRLKGNPLTVQMVVAIIILNKGHSHSVAALKCLL
jgi:hypothetical protein